MRSHLVLFVLVMLLVVSGFALLSNLHYARSAQGAAFFFAHDGGIGVRDPASSSVAAINTQLWSVIFVLLLFTLITLKLAEGHRLAVPITQVKTRRAKPALHPPKPIKGAAKSVRSRRRRR